MDRNTQKTDAKQSTSETNSVLEEVLRQGAQEMLLRAIDAEVDEYIDQHSNVRDETGHRLVVRNGHLPEREILTGIGPVPIRQPRVNDKRLGQKFTSNILPPFMRRIPSINALIPCLYLKGISTGDFSEALEAILGPQAAGLSATNIVRLKEGWRQDYKAWNKRECLEGERRIYGFIRSQISKGL